MFRRSEFALAAAVATLFASASATADSITGSLWKVSPSIAESTSFADVPVTPADVTFSVQTPFDFSITDSDTATVADFLASSSASSIVEATPGTLAAPADNVLLYFAGQMSLVNGRDYSIRHDDGVVLAIDGVNVLDKPGPTGATSDDFVWGGTTGNHPFRLVYTECCGGGAVLQADLPVAAAVPEPGAWALLATGLGFVAWRKRHMAV